MFTGYARLAFINDGTRYEPGQQVELPDESAQEQADLQRLLAMGVVQRTDPAGNTEQLDDTFTPDGRPGTGDVEAQVRNDGRPKGRAAAKLAEKARRDGAQ